MEGVFKASPSSSKEWTNLEEAVANRSYVVHLNLSKQNIKMLPSNIGQLNKVEICNLSGNDLSSSESFPEEFFELFNLKELDLSYNRLKELPPCLCMFLDLKRLDLTGNEFENPRKQASLVTSVFPDCVVTWDQMMQGRTPQARADDSKLTFLRFASKLL